MKKTATFFALLLSALLLSPASDAQEFFFHPQVAIGHNEAQGTYTVFGFDIGSALTENWSVGASAHFGAGEHPEHDQEIGGGPFVGYHLPLLSFLTANVREEIDYVDQRRPIKTVTSSGTSYSHARETGVISATSVGLHLSFSPNFSVSGGYRFVAALSNSALDDDRSGVFLGVAIGL